MLARARAWLRAAALSAGGDAAVAEALAGGVKQGVRGTLVDEAFGLIRRTVDENREIAVQLVQDRSRWWIAATVDRRVAGLAVTGVLSLLDELRAEDSDLRQRFEAAFDRVIDGLAADGALARAVAEARVGLVRSGALDDLALRLAASLRDGLAARVETDPDASPSRSRGCSATSPPGSAPTPTPAPRSTRASPPRSPAWSATCGRRSAATSPA